MTASSITRRNTREHLNLLLVALAVSCLAACAKTTPPQPFPDHHDGYWVTESEDSETGEKLTFINDVHTDPATRRITVYAQARRAGECGEDPSGHYGCFHPNAVYLNRNGVELDRAEGSGAWWVKHSWVLDGEGFDNCQLGLRAKESYRCIAAEGTVHEDGVSIQAGPTLFPLSLIYNTRTPLLDRDPVVTQVTRHGPLPRFSMLMECRAEPSPLDGVVRLCPSPSNR